MTTDNLIREVGWKVLSFVRPAFLMIALTLLMLAGVQEGFTRFVARDHSRVAYPKVGSAVPTLPAVHVTAPTRG